MRSPSELELRDYLEIFWRRKVFVAAVAVLAVAGALVVSSVQTPVYEATSTIVLQRQASDLVLDPAQAATTSNERTVNTELQVLRSQTVVDEAEAAVGRAIDVSAGVLGDSDVLEVRARSSDPEQAALDADAYAQTYVDVRRAQAVDELDQATQQVAARIDDINERLATLPEEAESERQGLESQRDLYTSQLDQLQLAAGLASGPIVLAVAEPPSSPISPQPVRNAILAFVVGLVLGLGLVFLREHLDDSIKTKEDLERATDTTVVGLIPTTARSKKAALVVAHEAVGSAFAEAYRTLRTSVQFLSLDRPIRSLQVTSVGAAEAKSTTVANLGLALASAGTRVVVVSCDLRRPTLHQLFDTTNEVGLTSVILGDATLADAVRPVGHESHLALLSSGPLPPNPSELLGSQRMRDLLRSIQERCDVVLLDSPPVLPVADAMVLSGLADATLLVARAGSTSAKDARRSVELLRQVGAPLVGTILSGVSAATYSGGGEYVPYLADPTGGNGGRSRARTPD